MSASHWKKTDQKTYDITMQTIMESNRRAAHTFWGSKTNIEDEIAQAWISSEKFTSYPSDDDDPYAFDSDSSIETQYNDYHCYNDQS